MLEAATIATSNIKSYSLTNIFTDKMITNTFFDFFDAENCKNK